jgi:UDP-N-acetylmuramoyl-tripeptide--D-alanyl-D-alanine ligase
MNVLVQLACGLAFAVAGVRWLRVSQREHYIPWSATRFSGRWWSCRPENVVLVAAALAGAVACWFLRPAAFVTAAAVAVGPLGLSLRGRTSRLRWTPRLCRLAGATAILAAGGEVATVATGSVGYAVLVTLFAPVVVDLAALVTWPLERFLSGGFVRRARERLEAVGPVVVAITGSFGKTTTKEYVRHLVSGARSVVASPASFNNRLGLARAINDHLTPGTNVFVAEMGTYGPGEIAEMVRWIRPTVSVFTALGPVHLERFGSLEAIAAAKAEIVGGADVVVINADEPLIEQAVSHAAKGARVIRCSLVDSGADVHVEVREGSMAVTADGVLLAELDRDLFPINVACAVAAALAVGVPREVAGRRLSSLPSPGHRRQVAQSSRGVTVIDDTYNANPAGAAAALQLLDRTARDGARRAVVTPGMVELGPEQQRANREFARRAARLATDLVVVGRTNRRALLSGSEGGAARVQVVDDRNQAVAWVRRNLNAGDAVLYENDLPDHYP